MTLHTSSSQVMGLGYRVEGNAFAELRSSAWLSRGVLALGSVLDILFLFHIVEPRRESEAVSF